MSFQWQTKVYYFYLFFATRYLVSDKMAFQVLKLYVFVLLITSQISANEGKYRRRIKRSKVSAEKFDASTFDFDSPESSKHLKNKVKQDDAITYELGTPKYEILNPDEQPEIIIHGQPHYFDNLKRYGQLTKDEEREYGGGSRNNSTTSSVRSKTEETTPTSENVEMQIHSPKKEVIHKKVEHTKEVRVKEIPSQTTECSKKDQVKFATEKQNSTKPDNIAVNKNLPVQDYSEKQRFNTNNDYQHKNYDHQLGNDRHEDQNAANSYRDSQQYSSIQHDESISQVKTQHINRERTPEIPRAKIQTPEHSQRTNLNHQFERSFPTLAPPYFYHNYKTEDLGQQIVDATPLTNIYANNHHDEQVHQNINPVIPFLYPRYQPAVQRQKSISIIPADYYPRPGIQNQKRKLEFTPALEQYPNYHTSQHLPASLYHRSSIPNIAVKPYGHNNHQNYRTIQPPHIHDLEHLYHAALAQHRRFGRSHFPKKNQQHFHQQFHPRVKYYYFINKKY